MYTPVQYALHKSQITLVDGDLSLISSGQPLSF